MDAQQLTPNQIISGEQEYIAALDLVIASAQQQLLIFDQNFSVGDFVNSKRHTLFKTFLNQNPASQLTIILQDASFFTTQCPRLFDLLANFGHKMAVYETNNHAKIAKDCFILADRKGYIRRFHINQSRFKFMLDDRETTASLANRFDELMQETTHTITATKLGL